MYIKRDSKYFTYLYFVDLVSIILSFMLSEVICFGGFGNVPDKYGMLLTIIVLADCCSMGLCKTFNGFFDRGYFKEFKSVFKATCITVLISLGCLFIAKVSSAYSRWFMLLVVVISFVFVYAARNIFKVCVMKKYSKTDAASKVMIVTTSDRIEDMYNHVHTKKYWDYTFSDIAVIDKDMVGQKAGQKIVAANADTMLELARTQVVDEVLINIGYHNPLLQVIVQEFQKMGITVHVVLNNLSFDMPNPRIERFSDYNVLTTCSNEITHRQLIGKRILDVCGALVGLLITGIVSIFVVPAIKHESPGPAIYKQERVGRNGRKFKIYKFRSMFMDADERKAALMEQNKMDGFMFKMDDDPRVTKIGKFIRKTSIDELPQFFNVLKGDMSLVGTRPPTVDEFEKYDSHHKNRLSFKPGLTGMWQVSGRSDLTDFEEVVKLDTKYIDNWSFGLDIKILILTVFSVLKRKGAE